MATKRIAASGGDYTTLSAWYGSLPATLTEPEIAELESFDLVDSLDMAGKTTSAANYIEIRAAAGHKHNGVFGSGARIRCGSSATISPILCSGRHVRIKDIEIYMDKSGATFGAMSIAGAVSGSDVRWENLLVRSVATGTVYCLAASTANLNITIKNCIVYSPCRSFDVRDAASGAIYNSVFYRTAAQIGVLAGSATEIKNCYSGASASGANDFWTGATPTGGNNASSDTTASFGTGNITSLAATSAFVAPGSLDFSISTGSSLKNAGATVASVTTDIAGASRPQGAAYDIGAFEFSESAGASATITGSTALPAFSGSAQVAPVTSITVTTALPAFSGGASMASASATVTATTSLPSFSGSATGDTSSGVLTLPVLKNNTGTVLANETGATVHVYAVSTGNKVVTKTGQATNASGVMTVTDALIVGGTQYRVVVVLGSGAEGLDKVTAS